MDESPARHTPSKARTVLAFVLTAAVLVSPAPLHSQSASARSRPETIRALIDAGHYVEAEASAEAFVSATRTEPAGTVDLDGAVALLVEALVRNGKGSDARTRALAEDVVRSTEARTGRSDPATASSLRLLGDVLIEAGEYQLAREPTERALRDSFIPSLPGFLRPRFAADHRRRDKRVRAQFAGLMQLGAAPATIRPVPSNDHGRTQTLRR